MAAVTNDHSTNSEGQKSERDPSGLHHGVSRAASFLSGGSRGTPVSVPFPAAGGCL